MFNKSEFWQHIFGEGSIALFAAALVYALIGALLMLLLSATKRDPLSPNTPTKFSWRYLLSDQNKRIIATIILIFLALRFSREWFGAQLTMYFALLIGMSCDGLVTLARNIRRPVPKSES